MKAGGRAAHNLPPLRIFLSHTSDLREHPADRSFVAAAEAAVVRAGHAVTDMAYFSARDSEPASHCAAMVGRADVYVGVIGPRYGTAVRDRADLSYTEFEFETATALGLPRLVFLIRPTAKHSPQVDQSAVESARQEAFLNRLHEAGITTAWIESPADLEIGLHQSLVELGAELDRRARRPRPRIGAKPRRATDAITVQSHPELDLLETGRSDSPSPLVKLWTQMDQPQLGNAISALRQRFGLTADGLVQRMWDVHPGGDLGVDRSLVYRWEKGERWRSRTRPGPRYRALLGLVCEREVEKLDPIPRREFLRALAALAAPPILPGLLSLEPDLLVHSSPPDPTVLDGLAALTRSYVQLHNTVSPAGLRAAISRHFDELVGFSLGSQPPSAATQVRSLAAQTGILAGWVSFNLQDVGQAYTYWSAAHDLAKDSGYASIQAHALACRSRLYSPIHRGPGGGDPEAALLLLDEASHLGKGNASPALRSWLLANRAQQLAVLGRASESDRDLDAATRLVSVGEQADEDMLSGWDELRVDAYRGICAMALHRPNEVIAITEPVVARTDPKRVQRCLQQCDLAAAYAELHEIDHACSLLREALGVAGRSQFLEGIQRARSVRAKHLQTHSGERAVQELDEFIATTNPSGSIPHPSGTVP